MRASRLLTILLTLQVRGRVTAQALADECEVSLRTIYRDIDALSMAGVPVYSERGHEGGYRLLDGYRTRLNGLSAEEAEALFLAGLPGPAADLGLGSVMAAAQLKLLVALPAEMRSVAENMRTRFHLDAQAWFNEADRPPHLPAVAEAVWHQKPVEFVYRGAKGESARRIEPLGIVLKNGIWYLIAASAGQLRTYRVSRIRKLTVLDERFERPAEFDLADYWQTSSRRYEASIFQARATLRLSPRGVAILEMWGGGFARAVMATGSAPDANGWRQIVLPIESVQRAASDLMRLGADAEVLEPAELRTLIAETAAATLRLYGGADASVLRDRNRSADDPSVLAA